MHVYSADALVLRTHRYGEADRIVVFLTEDRGKKRGVAKNASASRRRFGAALEPLTRGRATYVERETRELVRLDRVEPVETPLRAIDGRSAEDGASVLGHAAYFAELLDEWAPDSGPNARLFRLGAAAAQALACPGSIDALARYFEYWLLRLEGVYPAIDRCPRCKRSLAAGAVLVSAEHHYVCGACAPRGPQLSSTAMTFLAQAAHRTPADVVTAGGSAAALGELERVHSRLIADHLDRPVRSARVVKELRPTS